MANQLMGSIHLRGSKYFFSFGLCISIVNVFFSSWPLTGKGLIIVLVISTPVYFIFHSRKVGFSKEAFCDFFLQAGYSSICF